MRQYRDIYDAMKQHGVILKDAVFWHLTEPLLGEIAGLPSLRGTLVMANGNLAFMRLGLTEELVLIHLTNFIPDKPERSLVTKEKTTQKEKEKTKELCDYLSALGLEV